MRTLSVVASLALVGLAVAPTSEAEAADCVWEVEYSLAASLKITDTVMGEGDGSYAIGPGNVVLRYANDPGSGNGDVKMLRYAMRENFTIKAKTLFWTTTVVTDTHTGATPSACAVAAEGALDAHAIRWRTPVRGYRTDGSVTCTGSLCGRFGAPSPGQAPFHIPPSPVAFKPFVFSPDMHTFTMAMTRVAKTTSPRQSSDVSLVGREVRRACVQLPPCPP
jgi:hypothetical protein